MKKNSSTCNLFTEMQNSKGRFFGLYLANGDVINAQYRSQTNSYVTVYDRNSRTNRKFRKTSVLRATI